MMHISRILCLVSMCISMLGFAQENPKGIQWTTGLSWEQVKKKANQENKYIFLDCFTTWCGPCKIMDATVYGNDSVGDCFNDRFISVKVQMDKTKKDNEEVKRWYEDARVISQQYHVNAYPCFIFLSPNGTVVDKQVGFKGVKDFIKLGQNAMTPGKVYKDPFADYDRFVSEYKEGKRNYENYPAMITIATRLNENDFVNQLLKELSVYVRTLPRKKRYTKERLQMWNLFTFPSNTSVFRFFYQDGKLIDKTINQKGYAYRFVDKTIQSEIVAPFFAEQNKNKSIAMSGMYLTGKGLSSDSSNANWKKLRMQIREKYSMTYVKRNVLKAQVEWYKRHRNWLSYVEYSLDFLNNYWSMDIEGPWEVNNVAWDAFMYSTDKRIINGYIKWMEKVVEKVPDFSEGLDTYANLLYKAGRTEEAIKWEEKAMNLVEDKYKKLYKKVINQMRNGEPTYGAVWAYK